MLVPQSADSLIRGQTQDTCLKKYLSGLCACWKGRGSCLAALKALMGCWSSNGMTLNISRGSGVSYVHRHEGWNLDPEFRAVAYLLNQFNQQHLARLTREGISCIKADLCLQPAHWIALCSTLAYINPNPGISGKLQQSLPPQGCDWAFPAGQHHCIMDYSVL